MAQDTKTLSLIKSNKLFEYVSPEEVEISFSNKDVLTFNDGDIIYQTGDSAEQIYLIIDGSVKIKHAIAIDGQRIFEKGQGEFFGEKEFMDRDSRNSSAVAIRDSKLFILRRKELNNLFAKHRTLLNNIQGLDPTKDEHAEFRNTREAFPDEITNLLKTSESSLDPFGYKSPKKSVDMIHGAKEVAEEVEKIPEPLPAETEPKAVDEFPHRFKRTFEDSFTFGDIDKVIEAMDAPKAAPKQASNESVSESEDAGFAGLSWDFAAPESEPEDEMPLKPGTVEISDTFSFDETNVNTLGFHFPSEPETLSVSNTTETPSTFWEPEPMMTTAPSVPKETEETEAEDSFSWDFSSAKFDEEVTEPTEQPKVAGQDPRSVPFSFESAETPSWKFDDAPEVQAVKETVEQETSWSFTIPEETVVEEPIIPNPFAITLPDDDEPPTPVAEEPIVAPQVENKTLWELESFPDDMPIHGGTFDEFGNLIPDFVEESEVTEILNDEAAPAELKPEVPETKVNPTDSFRTSHIFDGHDDDHDAIHTHIMETELDGSSLQIDTVNEETKFGSQGFTFTAPLEVRQKETPVVNTVVPNEDVVTFAHLTTENLKLIIEAAKMVNSNVKLDEVLNQIVQAASLITSADRGTLYIVDHANEEIWSKIIRGEEIEEIRLKFGQGIAGWVAQTGETVNIKNAAEDSRFDRNIDKVTGYKTKSMICYAIKNKAGIIIAVIQLLNSKNGVFSELDEVFLEALSAHIAISLENAELVEQLLKTDRLTSLGKVAKFLISDIKKPILTIKQLAEHIRKKNVSPETNQVLGLMIEQSNIVVDLVLTTLSYSEGKTVLNKKVLGLHRVLDELLDLLAEYVEYRKTKLFKKYGPDVLVNVDRREMYQAFFQITKNACDAMPQGGELYVSARLTDNGEAVAVSFKDKGNGIPPMILEKIFEPFMAHGKPNGVGLGLPITEKIVKEHEGKVVIESKEGEGTTVTITFPVVREF